MPVQVSSALKRVLDAVREFQLAQRTLALLGVAVLVLGGVALGTGSVGDRRRARVGLAPSGR